MFCYVIYHLFIVLCLTFQTKKNCSCKGLQQFRNKQTNNKNACREGLLSDVWIQAQWHAFSTFFDLNWDNQGLDGVMLSAEAELRHDEKVSTCFLPLAYILYLQYSQAKIIQFVTNIFNQQSPLSTPQAFCWIFNSPQKCLLIHGNCVFLLSVPLIQNK